MEYRELYFTLFNRVTDLIEELQNIQCQMEKLYIESDIESDLSEADELAPAALP